MLGSQRPQSRLERSWFRDKGTLCQAVAAVKLVLRKAADLESENLGDIKAETSLVVFEECYVEGVLRARVGKDSTPRGVCAQSLGWVTAMKDGEVKLIPSGGGSFDISELLAATSEATGGSPDLGAVSDSMASRIAARRRNRERSHSPSGKSSARAADAPEASGAGVPESAPESTPAPVAAPSPSAAGPPKPASPATQRKGSTAAAAAAAAPSSSADEAEPDAKPVPKFEFVGNVEKLQDIIVGYLAKAEEEEGKTFDTVGSKLGRLLLDKKVDVPALMKEWDRNNDGDISKQEFRLNVRKLGMGDADATTAQLDALYDSLDLDGSGNLDIGEMKEALKALQADVKEVVGRNKRLTDYVADLRAVADLYKASVADADGFQKAKISQDRVKRAGTNGSPPQMLATLFKKKGLNVHEVVSKWDQDGGGSVDQGEFAGHVRDLGLDASDHELSELFQLLDDDASGELEISEVALAMKNLLTMASSAKEAKAAEKAATAVTAKKRKAAEASQMAAYEAMLEAERKHDAAEESAGAAAKAKAKAKAEIARQAREAKKEFAAKVAANNAKLSSFTDKEKAAAA